MLKSCKPCTVQFWGTPGETFLSPRASLVGYCTISKGAHVFAMLSYWWIAPRSHPLFTARRTCTVAGLAVVVLVFISSSMGITAEVNTGVGHLPSSERLGEPPLASLGAPSAVDSWTCLPLCDGSSCKGTHIKCRLHLGLIPTSHADPSSGSSLVHRRAQSRES